MFDNPSDSNPQLKSFGFSRHFLFRRRELLIATLLVGVGLSLLLGWGFSKSQQRFIKKQFDAEAEHRVQEFRTALADRFAILHFISSFYASSDDVERREFNAFTQPILPKTENADSKTENADSETHNADIEFLAWLPRVPERLRADFERQMQKNGVADGPIREFSSGGKLQPAGKRSVYYPLMFVEPQNEHRHLFGFDLASDEPARAAIERVMANKQPTVAQCNIPQPNGESRQVFCLFEFAQSAPFPADTPKLVRRLNSGVVVSAIRLPTLLEEAIEPLPQSGVNMYFYDEIEPEKTSLILARPSRLEKRPLTQLESPPENRREMNYLTRFPLQDRRWIAYCVPIDSYVSRNRSWEPLMAVIGGLLATAILMGYLYLLVGRTEQVELLADRRTEALRVSQERFRLLIDGAGDAFFLHDSQGCILDVNRRACECLGYTRAELLKMNIADIDVQPYKVNEREWPWNLPDAAYPQTFEGVHRRKNGETFPVEVRLSCQDRGGQRWLLGLARDITERKQAEAALQSEQRLLRQLLDLLDNDRKLVAYEIHDGLAQQLTGLSLQLQIMQARQENDPAAAWKILPKALELTKQCITEARRLIGGLRPPILDRSGVVAAIEYLVGEKRQTETTEIVFRHDVRFRHLAAPLETAIFRIAQECLTNACRYSQSQKIEIELTQPDGTVQLKIQDWGVGFDPQQNGGGHFGLRGIRERARLLGGCAEIISAPQQGTTITVRLPLIERAAEEDD